MKETVLVIDFGGQYNQLIARRVRDLNVYCELIPCGTPLEKIKAKNPIGIIFTGGPNSVFGADALKVDEGIYTLGVPVLGICYGAQLIAHQLGGKVRSAAVGEYGQVKAVYKKSVIFDGLPEEGVCWMSHTDSVSELPDGFEITAFTADCPVAAMQNTQKRIYAVQFHPEVAHTQNGTLMLKNFLYKACGASGDWTMKDFVARKVAEIREKVGDKKVLCAMSGGVDSAVAATLVHRAVGDRLTCVYVDHGLMRKNETEEVRQVFKDGLGMNLILADAEELFLRKLAGVTDPESKRKIIGREFITVFEKEAEKIGKVDYLVQGTIYPDVIESGSGDSAVIKSHHNVGGLPDVVDFEEIIEPLRDLFKDEVRAVGFELGLPEQVVMRQPFPGPGLGIRVIGEVTEDKLEILREADAIFREEIKNAGLDRNHVVMCKVYITDMKGWDEANAAYAEFFGNHKPARAIYETARTHHGGHIEIEAVAEL